MATENKIEVELLVDYWPEADVRVDRGTVIALPVEQAMDMVERGIVKRHKKAG